MHAEMIGGPVDGIVIPLRDEPPGQLLVQLGPRWYLYAHENHGGVLTVAPIRLSPAYAKTECNDDDRTKYVYEKPMSEEEVRKLATS